MASGQTLKHVYPLARKSIDACLNVMLNIECIHKKTAINNREDYLVTASLSTIEAYKISFRLSSRT